MVSWIQRTPAGTRGWRRFDANGTMAYAGHIREPLTFNRYSDVMGGPLNYVDPSGHYADLDISIDFVTVIENKEPPAIYFDSDFINLASEIEAPVDMDTYVN